METRQFRKNSHISQKSFYARMRWFFTQFEKEYFAKLQWKPFFRIYRSHGVCKMSYDQSSMYYNLQETLNTWPLSSIRGFACHSRLNNLHCTRLRRSVALIWPPELISATLVYACVYMSRAAHISEAALCAASVKIHAHASLLLKYSQNPVKFRCHDLSREEKNKFLSHNIC